MAAGFAFGVVDGAMLTRVANLSSQYIIANYDRVQGGPTGAAVCRQTRKAGPSE